MILALDTDLTGMGDAFDSGTQGMTSSMVTKENPDWRKIASNADESTH
jgi:hypothetical protein